MPVRRRVGNFLKQLVNSFEVVRHERTKSRERTARKNERDGEGVSTKRAQTHRATQLIGELIFRQEIADGERFDLAHDSHWGVRRKDVGVRRNSGLLLDAFDPAICLGDVHLKRDGVASGESGEFVRIANIKRHRHGGHVVGNFLVSDAHRLAACC